MDQAPLTIVTWKWRSKTYRHEFTAEHVNTLASMVERCYRRPHRFVCITDDPKGLECESFPLWRDCDDLVNASGEQLPSCYRRLKLFSREIGEQLGPRVLSLDLDAVLLGDVTDLWSRDEPFVGWRVPATTQHRTALNGSMFLFDTEDSGNQAIWDRFDPRTSPQEAAAAGWKGSDQSWISYMRAESAASWGLEDGVVRYHNEVRPNGGLPTGSRIVFFNGKRKPWDPKVQAEAPWIAQHWRRDPIDPLTVVTWKWSQEGYPKRFTADDVNRMQRMVARHYPTEHRFVCVTDDPTGVQCETIPLWDEFADIPNPTDPVRRPSCFRRLRIFSKEAEAVFGKRLVSVDLDAVVVGDLRPLWDITDKFRIYRDPAYRPCNGVSPFNGSMFLMKTGARSNVYDIFRADPEAALERIRKKKLRGSDQAWLGAHLPLAEKTWDQRDGVYWSRMIATQLPRHAKIVFGSGASETLDRYPWARPHLCV